MAADRGEGNGFAIIGFVFLLSAGKGGGESVPASLSLLLGPSCVLWPQTTWGASGGRRDGGRVWDSASPHCSGLCLNLALKTHPFRFLRRLSPTPSMLCPACTQVEDIGPLGMTHS